MKQAQLTITGRPIAKKNSKRIFRNRRTGKPMLVPSAAYKRFEGSAVVQIMQQQSQIDNLTCPCHLDVVFHIKGQYKVDIDNLISSICDILELTGVVENDYLITSVAARKVQDADDWMTDIKLVEESYEPGTG